LEFSRSETKRCVASSFEFGRIRDHTPQSMKLTHRIIVGSLLAALALPAATFAAKGERKKQKPGAEEIPAFASVDKDSNEAISETEFVTANEKLGSVAAKARFELLDKDHNGKLSKEEYAAGATPEKKKRKKKNQE
jgi:hypothetical protein